MPPATTSARSVAPSYSGLGYSQLQIYNFAILTASCKHLLSPKVVVTKISIESIKYAYQLHRVSLRSVQENVVLLKMIDFSSILTKTEIPVNSSRLETE